MSSSRSDIPHITSGTSSNEIEKASLHPSICTMASSSLPNISQCKDIFDIAAAALFNDSKNFFISPVIISLLRAHINLMADVTILPNPTPKAKSFISLSQPGFYLMLATLNFTSFRTCSSIM
jgi:hypothetical protein